MNLGYNLRTPCSPGPVPVTTQVSQYTLVENIRARSHPHLGAYALAQSPTVCSHSNDAHVDRYQCDPIKTSPTHATSSYLQCDDQPVTSTRGHQISAAQIDNWRVSFCRARTCGFALRSSLLLDQYRDEYPFGCIQIRKNGKLRTCNGANEHILSNSPTPCTTTHRNNVRRTNPSKSESDGAHKSRQRRFKARRPPVNVELDTNDQTFIHHMDLDKHFHLWKLSRVETRCVKMIQRHYREYKKHSNEWLII